MNKHIEDFVNMLMTFFSQLKNDNKSFIFNHKIIFLNLVLYNFLSFMFSLNIFIHIFILTNFRASCEYEGDCLTVKSDAKAMQ